MSHFLVLSAAASLGDAAVAGVYEALRAGDVAAGAPVRLAPGAVEIALETALAPEAARAMVGELPIDANVVAAAGRRKRLLIADMDSTIITVECIDELADFAGVKPEVAAITKAAMRGELDFEAALAARVRLLEGLDVEILRRCYDERVRLSPGARVLVRTMAALGAETALVSGGFTVFSERVAAAAGFARHRANVLECAAGRLTGTVARPILGREAKQAALEALSEEAGLAPACAVAIGDGANDLDMIAAAGLGVAYRARPALAAAADARLAHSDLTAVLALQGIPHSEWRA